MTRKQTLHEKYVVLTEQHAAEERAESDAERVLDAAFVLGGMRAVRNLAEEMNSQIMRAVQRVRDEELYKPLGFTRFDTFLDESHYSPMTYKQFNDREKILLNEGDELFNLLNAINAPMAKRRLLGKGEVTVEGEEVIIRDETAEHRVDVSDRATLLSTLSRLADKCSEQTRTIERGKKDNERLKKRLVNAEHAALPAPLDRTPFADALFNAIASLGLLATRAGELSLVEVGLERDRAMTLLRQQWDALHKALRFDKPLDTATDDILTAHDLDALEEEM